MRHAILQAERAEQARLRAELDALYNANWQLRERERMAAADREASYVRELERDPDRLNEIAAIIAAGDDD